MSGTRTTPELTGQTIHEWTVLERVTAPGNRRYHCRCSCGALSIVSHSALRMGKSTRCGKCAVKLRKSQGRGWR